MSNVARPLPLAVVTGAACAIALELSRELLGRGHDVVMVADSDLVHGAARSRSRSPSANELHDSKVTVTSLMSVPTGVLRNRSLRNGSDPVQSWSC